MTLHLWYAALGPSRKRIISGGTVLVTLVQYHRVFDWVTAASYLPPLLFTGAGCLFPLLHHHLVGSVSSDPDGLCLLSGIADPIPEYLPVEATP